ncbi:monooxygenase [Mucor velutinosus]|uniref:Monooxygenase n=1 Tax=Mucor velutinosus TaxID=708070 RepID=A0AAN7D9Z2_9FUNG|nr:monooxygenase [Mucor velutinosus]
MTRSSPTLSMEKAQQQFREPPPARLTINAVSANSSSARPHAISPNGYSANSPGSYTSYSSADYSSIGVLNNNIKMK